MDRNVKLTGEAFFIVRHNPDKPFVVQSNRISVKATGTRFNVLAYNREKRIEATLEEGKIQVILNNENPIDVLPGQQVVYYKNVGESVVREADLSACFGWKEHQIIFNDTPFDEVLLKLNRTYNVDFMIRHNELLDLKYTGTFIDETIEEIMQMLSLVSPIDYEIHYRTEVNDSNYVEPLIVIRMNQYHITN